MLMLSSPIYLQLNVRRTSNNCLTLKYTASGQSWALNGRDKKLFHDKGKFTSYQIQSSFVQGDKPCRERLQPQQLHLTQPWATSSIMLTQVQRTPSIHAAKPLKVSSVTSKCGPASSYSSVKYTGKLLEE